MRSVKAASKELSDLTGAQHLNETKKTVTHTLPKATRRYSPYSYGLSHPFLGVGRFSAISLPIQLIFKLSQKLLKTKTLLRAPDGLRDKEIKRWAQYSYESSQPPSRKTSTPQDSHSQVKQVHAKLSSISTISQSSSYKTPKTKIKTPSTTLLRQVFNVSSFLRFFASSPKVLRRYTPPLFVVRCGDVGKRRGHLAFPSHSKREDCQSSPCFVLRGQADQAFPERLS